MNKWISVKDKLPERRKIILLYNNKFEDFFIGYLDSWILWDDFFWYYYDSCRLCVYRDKYPFEQISHWMPLPKAPEEK